MHQGALAMLPYLARIGYMVSSRRCGEAKNLILLEIYRMLLAIKSLMTKYGSNL